MHECRNAGGPGWLLGLALDLAALALVSVVIWLAVRREARPAAGVRPDGRLRRGHRLRERMRRTVGLVVSVLLIGHWLLGLAHVGSARLAILGGAGFAILLPVLAMVRLGAVARRQRPVRTTPMPVSAVQGPIRWALPALAATGAVGATAVLALHLTLGRSC